jgi:BirA family transcriptional regulator, biotin operon repressor / biotin---[acetyl-CoA-carboxylase] ligase
MPPTHYKILQLDEVDSTNEFAKRLILEEPVKGNYIIIADHQTRGKGRLGRIWESPRGEGLWMSIILGAGKSHDRLVWYNFMASLSVCETLSELTHKNFELKWPNDILLHGKKACGILLETVNKNSELFLIIGIGININQKEFSEPLDKTATSLLMETGKTWDRSEILEHTVSKFDHYRSNLSVEIFKRWKTKSTMFGKPITVIQGEKSFEALAIDMGDDGALIVERDGKKEKLYAGDVRIRLN